MSDVRFNQWLHQSGTGGVSQVSGGHVGIGTTNPEIAVHSGNTKVLNVGIVTASTYYGNGANLTGLAGGATGLDLDDNIKIRLGNSQDLQLYHDGNHSYIDDAGTGNLRLRSGTLEITNAAGSKTSAVFNSGSSQDLYFNNTKRFETLNDGIRVSGHIYANDNQYLKLGTSQDLKIYHDGSNSLVNADGTGNLIIQGANDIILRPADGEVGIDINANGAVELYHNNVKKFETWSGGSQVHGSLHTDELFLQDNEKIKLGNGDDLQLYHNGSQSYVANSTGNLNLTSAGAVVTKVNSSEDAIVCHANGSVDLYHDNSKKLETKTGGVAIFNELSVGTSAVQQASVASFVGGQYNQVNIADGSNSGWGLLLAQQQGTSTTTSYTYSTNSSVNKPCSVVNVNNDCIHFATNNAPRFRIEHDGHVIPSANNSYDLGSGSYRWRNVYTNDLNLSNKGSTNSVDNTWGDYTIQEGESDLFLINNRSGKKYKFNLTEVS